mgnify:FL=1
MATAWAKTTVIPAFAGKTGRVDLIPVALKLCAMLL